MGILVKVSNCKYIKYKTKQRERERERQRQRERKEGRNSVGSEGVKGNGQLLGQNNLRVHAMLRSSSLWTYCGPILYVKHYSPP